MGISERINARRRAMQMTQAQLAELVGVSFQAVSSWERGEYLPDTDKLCALASALNTSAAYLLGEEERLDAFADAPERLFSEERMYTQVKSAAHAKGLMQTSVALPYAKRQHEGQVRKGKEHIPYISHPLMMACHALALGIADDDVLAAVLLHDVCEDCGVEPKALPVGDAVREAVALLTYEVLPGETKEEAKARYFLAIRENRIASIVKVLDRCNNISTMTVGFTRQRIAYYIVETETYIMPLLTHIKETVPEYYNAAFLLKYHMKSILESLKRMV